MLSLVFLIFQLRAFSFNHLRDLSLLAGNLYSSISISSFSISLCSEGEWAVSVCSL